MASVQSLRLPEPQEPPIAQRFGLGFLGDIVTSIFGGDEAEELQSKPPATCSEQPTFSTESPVPVSINADSAIDFVKKMKAALGGNPHMTPQPTWDLELDEKGKVTKVNFVLKTSIVRPRWSGGRLGGGVQDPAERKKREDEERALIKKVEDLIAAHEARHREVARDYARRAVCAALGKTGQAAVAAMKKVLCDMEKAQEQLDKSEGTLKWTPSPDGTRVIDVSLAGEPSASYPCS